MIKIRTAQIKIFEDEALKHFEAEMVLHSKKYSPRLCEILGEDQLLVVLRQTIGRADSYGFTNRGSIRLYIELMFLYGSDFDTDPQCSELAQVLNTPDDQMQRAEQIYQSILYYQKTVSGPDNIYKREALEALLISTKMPVLINTNNFEMEMYQELVRTFPQKVAYVGQKGIYSIISKARIEAQKHGFSTVHDEAMMVILLFAFGHGCTNDPLYPWISQTLKDESINDSVDRAKLLEKKAAAWLNVCLLGMKGGEGK